MDHYALHVILTNALRADCQIILQTISVVNALEVIFSQIKVANYAL